MLTEKSTRLTYVATRFVQSQGMLIWRRTVSGQCTSAVRTAPNYSDNLKAVKGALTTPHLRYIAWKPSYDSFDLNYSDFTYKSSLLILGGFLIISSIYDILIL
jgi:hypothetical protein